MANGHTSAPLSPRFNMPRMTIALFRMFTAQLICQGVCRQADVVRAFGVSPGSEGHSRYRDQWLRHRRGRPAESPGWVQPPSGQANRFRDAGEGYPPGHRRLSETVVLSPGPG